ncbi:HET domain containing protein [Hyaloscypha variabilis]
MYEPFQYTPLDTSSNAIRLLTIRPPNPSQPSIIECSLSQSSLDNHPKYHALSYAWKDEYLEEQLNESHAIIVNGRSLKVGFNLASALEARRDRDDGHIPIWIDAICINQENLGEKSHQILRMRQIYAQSTLVTVWLGPERDDSEKAFEMIRTISQLKDNAKEWLIDSLTTRKHCKEWHALYHMLRRAWWRRIWIIQEVVAAKEVLFLCGKLSLNPSDISKCLRILSTHQRTQQPLLFKQAAIVLEYGTFSLASSYLRQTPWIDNSILQTLYKTGLALASDPRDKIYAVLNLASDGAKLIPRPDYKLSTAVVYTQLVISIIQSTNRLDVLSLASSTVYPRTLDEELPSWVPDFSQRATSSINSSFSSLRPVSADEDSVAITSFNHNFRTLSVRGFVIDSIDGLAQVLGTETSSHGNSLQQSKSKHAPHWPSGATRTIQVITQSLLAGPKTPVPALREERMQEIADSFAEDYRQFASNHGEHSYTTPPRSSHWFYHNQDLVAFGKSIKQWVLEYTSPTTSNISPGGFFDYRSSRHWYSRRLFTTVAGNVGLGGNLCRPGDLICILLGCSTPIVLRPKQLAFQLIGEAYVHGSMDGEAMKGVEAGKYYMRDFEII